ncbi:hypothetical protein CEXT_136261 [Caerostris extrusa]|uniref:Uncharacterized protein n=1 Tax=Caerostris extrusa TaxID=172846 RepID=A0AAV4VKL0_CAEEX|nr:hypothetical protein CEXT_136261 [Caerostris extrusa]
MNGEIDEFSSGSRHGRGCPSQGWSEISFAQPRCMRRFQPDVPVLITQEDLKRSGGPVLFTLRGSGVVWWSTINYSRGFEVVWSFSVNYSRGSGIRSDGSILITHEDLNRSGGPVLITLRGSGIVWWFSINY